MTIVNSSLTSAVIYPDRARLTRSGKISLKRGKHQLEIKDLSLRMNPESARAAAAGTAQARLLGLQTKRVFYPETPVEKTRELEERLEKLQDELNSFQAKFDLISHERSRLKALAGHTDLFATALVSGESDIEKQFNIFDRLRKRSEQLDAENLGLTITKRKLEREIQQLQNQLDQIHNTRSKERYSVFLDVEMLDEGELTVEISYVVSGVGWMPLYDLRYYDNRTGHELEINYLAQVSQKTGEDWIDVNMTLSTARPSLSSILPELEPWYIRPVQAEFSIRSEYSREEEKPNARLLMKAAPAPPIALQDAESYKAEEVRARVDDTGVSVTYQIPDTVTILADGSPHKVSVTKISLSPELDYITAPRLVDAVYRRVKVTNDSPYTILPGTANLFSGDEFIGRTEMELTAPKGEIELYFGTDDRIKIERELKRQDVDKRLMGSKRRLEYGYEICLENLLSFDIDIIVKDQIPISQDEEIKVRLENSKPKPSVQTELNILEWNLNLVAGGKQTIRFDFEIEYPQKMRLSNIGQRDKDLDDILF